MTNAQAISMLVGVVIPIVVGLVTKAHASSGVKAITNALLSAIAAALTQLATTFTWKAFVVTALSTWAVSVATHYGLYKPTGATDAVVNATPNFGIGGKTPTAQAT